MRKCRTLTPRPITAEVTAHHEAGHAVVAHLFHVAICGEGVTVEGAGHGSCPIELPTDLPRRLYADPETRPQARDEVWRAVSVYLAGIAAEGVYLSTQRPGWLLAWDKLLRDLDAADLSGRPGDVDFAGSLLREWHALTGEPARDMAARILQATRQLLSLPAHWAAVQGVAAALLERGRLSHDELNALCEGLGVLRGSAPPPPSLVTI